jgi:hypothetical protein
MDSRSAKPRATLGPTAATAGPRAAGEAERLDFCRLLRAARERASLSIENISRITRIPEHSLRRLEAGEFEDLPADVFVRGFLRSYARCVGLDADDVVRRYAECGALDPAPVASDLARIAAEQAAAAAAHDDDVPEVISRPSSEAQPRAASLPWSDTLVDDSLAVATVEESAARPAWEHADGTGEDTLAGESSRDPGEARGRGGKHRRRDRHARRRASTALPFGARGREVASGTGVRGGRVTDEDELPTIDTASAAGRAVTQKGVGPVGGEVIGPARTPEPAREVPAAATAAPVRATGRASTQGVGRASSQGGGRASTQGVGRASSQGAGRRGSGHGRQAPASAPIPARTHAPRPSAGSRADRRAADRGRAAPTESGERRGPVFLAVAVAALVVAAILTMSYLLRRPEGGPADRRGAPGAAPR